MKKLFKEALDPLFFFKSWATLSQSSILKHCKYYIFLNIIYTKKIASVSFVVSFHIRTRNVQYSSMRASLPGTFQL